MEFLKRYIFVLVLSFLFRCSITPQPVPPGENDGFGGDAVSSELTDPLPSQEISSGEYDFGEAGAFDVLEDQVPICEEGYEQIEVDRCEVVEEVLDELPETVDVVFGEVFEAEGDAELWEEIEESYEEEIEEIIEEGTDIRAPQETEEDGFEDETDTGDGSF